MVSNNIWLRLCLLICPWILLNFRVMLKERRPLSIWLFLKKLKEFLADILWTVRCGYFVARHKGNQIRHYAMMSSC